MTFWETVIVVLASVLAGGINSVVGSGTLITFPVLMAVGYPPVVANVSNGLGLVLGSVSGAIGYRKELTGQAPLVLRFAVASVLGGIVGAVLLLVLPADAFEMIVPVLIGIALVLVVLQPWLSRKLAERGQNGHVGVPLLLGVFCCGVYGGYFGAAQGILVVALLAILMNMALQKANAIKNVLVALVNLASGIVFVFIADVAWEAVAAVAAGAVVGGLLGARIGRKLSPTLLRGVIVVVGVAAIVQLVTR